MDWTKIGRGSNTWPMPETKGLTRALSDFSEFLVLQKVDVKETLSSREVPNAYSIKNSEGLLLLTVVEEFGGFGRWAERRFLKKLRPFQARVLDNDSSFVSTIVRPFTFLNARMILLDSNGTRIGEIKQHLTFGKRLFKVYGGDGTERYS